MVHVVYLVFQISVPHFKGGTYLRGVLERGGCLFRIFMFCPRRLLEKSGEKKLGAYLIFTVVIY